MPQSETNHEFICGKNAHVQVWCDILFSLFIQEQSLECLLGGIHLL